MRAWQWQYRRAAFIDMGIGDSAAAEAQARDEAARRGWAFERFSGDLGLMRRLLDGAWNDDMLIAQAGEEVLMTGDERIVAGVPTTSATFARGDVPCATIISPFQG